MKTGRSFWILLLMVAALVFTATALAQGGVGSAPAGATSGEDVESLLPAVTEYGMISLSVDGTGMIAGAGTIDVEKPAGATVRGAYLATASTGFSGYTIPDGEITLDGVGVAWDTTLANSISSYNHWADVTTIVKPVVDAAAAGTVAVDYTEASSTLVDGSILSVIFDDPGAAADNTIVLLFGAQDVAGDTFAIALTDPIDLGDPDLVLDMGLGISYGCQSVNCGSNQISQVDVNGTRITSSSGGFDDGEEANGALLTVGGLGDSNTNPPDPFSGPQNDSRYDDELYDLIPFVTDGDTQIDVFTINPSIDDNIYFAHLNLGGLTAVVGEGIVLSPAAARNCPPSDHNMTAFVQDGDGLPVEGVDVTFEVTAGPHAGVTDMDTTDVNGEADFTYNGTLNGVDTIVASFMDAAGGTVFSNEATKIWECRPTDVSLTGLGGETAPPLAGLLAAAVAALLIPVALVLRRRSRIQAD